MTRSLQSSILTIVRIQKIMERSVPTAHGELKLAPPDMQTLRFIAHHPGCMSVAVAHHLGVVPTTATSVVDRLVKRGFVDRVRPEENRRSVALHLTEAGRDAFGRIDAEELASSQAMLDVLPAEEREPFVTAMALIAEAFLRNRQAGPPTDLDGTAKRRGGAAVP